MATQSGGYQVIREGEEVVLKVNYDGAMVIPSIEESNTVMSKVIDIMTETGRVTKIILNQKRDYEYDYQQVLMLFEIAMLYKDFVKERFNKSDLVDTACPYAASEFTKRYAEVTTLLHRLMKSDPLGAESRGKSIRGDNRPGHLA